jgi:hypothetical protein
MLLRRVLDHVRGQEWTAVALDFVIVVVGVFIGIQAANWNEARADAALARDYLERIQRDLSADIARYENRIRFWSTVSNYGRKGLAYAETGQRGEATQWNLLLAYFQASQVAEFWTRSTTYDELKSAGELRLIGNLQVRDGLAHYYTDAGNPALTERPAYREHVRGVIPIDVQLHIWTKCYASDASGEQVLRKCGSPITETRAAEVVDAIRKDRALMSELRYWMSTMQVASQIGRDRTEFARQMLASVQAELGNEGR